MKYDEAPKLPPDVEPTIKPKKKKEELKRPEPETDMNGNINGNGNGIKLQRIRWKNRRRMAWTSMIMMVLLTTVLIVTALLTDIDMNRLKPIAEPLAWSYLGFTSVIGAYMGFTTWASKGRR